jgi:uncharacterized secreted protein with C-terminal beta-propeller domain
MDYNNTAILAKDKEHAKKIIAFYKNKGYDTVGYNGFFNYFPKYYGVEDNNFKFFCTTVLKSTTKIIELPLKYPRVMMVSSVAGRWFKRVVFMEKNNIYLAWESAETLEDAKKVSSTAAWLYAKEVEEETTEITIEEIAKLLNKPKHLIKIIDK